MRNPVDLSGRHLLVTGASADSDIGRSLCLNLTDLGARLILVGRREAALAETRALLPDPDSHTVAPFDLSDLDAIPGWMKGLAAQAGPLDGLVHSASHQGYSVLRNLKRMQIDQYFGVNLGAALMLARGFRQKGVSRTPASLVFISSIAGMVGQRGRVLYASSKAALNAAARSLALELAEDGIRVNALAPALVRGTQADKQIAMLTPEQNAALAAAHPLGFGEPQDVADAVAFLLSNASRWITGITLPLDGGFSAQ